MTLLTRKIGTDDVSALGLGLMALSGAFGSIFNNDDERFEILDAAVDLGFTHWDTADRYGDSEDLIGSWFKRSGKRDKIFLATKFGVTPAGSDGRPEYVKTSIEKSLKRLGVDTIDLYYLHRADLNTPIEITVGAMAELVKEGKVRYLGLSEVSAATLRRAHAIHPIAAVQVEYSPFFLDIEDEEKNGLLKACRELGVAVVAYAPLGKGILSGTFKSRDDIPQSDHRRNIPKFSEENFPNILKLVEGLEGMGQKYNATASQITLAWLLAQGQDILPIPSTKRIKYLKENMEATKIQLTPDDVQAIRLIVEKADIFPGDRYADAAHRTLLFADTPPL